MHVRYTLASAPLVVHACHCTHCQRETGSAFALNAFYEPSRVTTTFSADTAGSTLLQTAVPSLKGGQVMSRCAKCYCVIWSTYSAGVGILIVRVGTIDGVKDEQGHSIANGGLRPDAHLFVSKGHRWIGLEGVKVYEELGKKEEYWSQESLERMRMFVEEKNSSK